ncbi:MAG: DUF2344 domain-containing protein [Oscillospiraceae bacterium]|nr:DUF2344 domain-containing protein [Oscillospiraceae bacterium]
MNRLAFCKADTAKYISHLDLMRTFQRAFQRAGIAIKHTEGFNPHAFVSLPLPLPVGFSSGCEVLECEIVDGTALETVPARMNRVLPDGIVIQRCYEGDRPIKTLSYVNYIVMMDYETGAPYGVESKIQDLLSQKELIVSKRSKKAKSGQVEVDLIPLIAKAAVEERRDAIVLDLTLKAQNPGLNPTLLMSAICQAYPEEQPDFISYHRRSFFDTAFQRWE